MIHIPEGDLTPTPVSDGGEGSCLGCLAALFGLAVVAMMIALGLYINVPGFLALFGPVPDTPGKDVYILKVFAVVFVAIVIALPVIFIVVANAKKK